HAPSPRPRYRDQGHRAGDGIIGQVGAQDDILIAQKSQTQRKEGRALQHLAHDIERRVDQFSHDKSIPRGKAGQAALASMARISSLPMRPALPSGNWPLTATRSATASGEMAIGWTSESSTGESMRAKKGF